MKKCPLEKHPAITLRDVGRKALSQAFSIDMKNLLKTLRRNGGRRCRLGCVDTCYPRSIPKLNVQEGQGSNLRHAVLETAALPSELPPRWKAAVFRNMSGRKTLP